MKHWHLPKAKYPDRPKHHTHIHTFRCSSCLPFFGRSHPGLRSLTLARGETARPRTCAWAPLFSGPLGWVNEYTSPSLSPPVRCLICESIPGCTLYSSNAGSALPRIPDPAIGDRTFIGSSHSHNTHVPLIQCQKREFKRNSIKATKAQRLSRLLLWLLLLMMNNNNICICMYNKSYYLCK